MWLMINDYAEDCVDCDDENKGLVENWKVAVQTYTDAS